MTAEVAVSKGHETASDLRRTIRLFRRFMGSPRIYVAGVVLLVIEAATAIFEAYPIAYLIDFLQGARPGLAFELGVPDLLGSDRWGTILVLTVAIIGIAAINSAADSLAEICMARGGRSLGYAVRVAMYSHLQRLPLAYHDSKRTGDVLTRVTGDVLVVEEFVVGSISNILGSLLVLVGSFAFLFAQSPSVALVALFAVPVLAIVSDFFSRRIKSASKAQRSREGELASTTQEMLTSIRLVQSYGRGTVDRARFADQTARSMRASLSAATIQAQFSFAIAIAEALAICAVIWLGVWLVDRAALTIGTLVLFVLLLQNMFKPARKIVSEWYKIGKVFASVERIDDLLGRELGVEDQPGARTAPPLEGRLSFRNVSFAYAAEHEDGTQKASRRAVLRNVSFDISPGEVVALVGPSGAGKSTIAQLVPRLYDPDDGEVLVDGHPLRTLTLASLRSQVSLVLQETMLLSGSVAENIGYGIDNATQADIEAAARQANAHAFIMELPDGYETELGERGATLSGGQRQRIAIARAFIRRTPILILDEPTTGLDAEASRLVVAALRGLMRGKTTILISHDTALVQTADRALVLSDGQIVDTTERERPARTEVNAAEPVAPRRRMGSRVAEAADGPQELVDGLVRKLPVVGPALDPDFAARQIVPLLLRRGVELRDIRVEKLWLQADETFALRYRLRLADGSEHHVLARIHGDTGQSARYLEQAVMPLAADDPPARTQPWRQWAAMADGLPIVVHPYPIDPGLPTLARASDPAVIRELAHLAPGGDTTPAVGLVHYPRDGSCVLRYDFPFEAAGATTARPVSLYGKVYADDTVQVVEDFLSALVRSRGRDAGLAGARFSRPVMFDPSLRLLVTSELAGEPLTRQIRAALAPHDGNGVGAPTMGDIESALAAAGRALAAFHRSDLTTAPTHPMAAELHDLRRELQLVGRTWPDVEAKLRQHADHLAREAPRAPDLVLSHGDFTPAQVLVGDTAGVVDLDRLCWADPASDLGRFVAHLEMLVVKARPDGGRSLADRFGVAFLRGYVEADGSTGDDSTIDARVDFYRRSSLLRSALNACRQLKPARVGLAMSLFTSRDTPSGRLES